MAFLLLCLGKHMCFKCFIYGMAQRVFLSVIFLLDEEGRSVSVDGLVTNLVMSDDTIFDRTNYCSKL